MILKKLDHSQFLQATLPLAAKFAGAQAGMIEGYASLFGGEPDAYGHIVAAGAYARSLEAHRRDGTRPVMLWSHDPASPIGHWETVKEDAKGLWVVGQLNLETDLGRQAHEHIKAGDVNGLSIGYRVPPDGATLNLADGTITLTEIDLLEVSVVAVPANWQARISGVKGGRLSSQRELEQLLHRNGLPHGAAAKLAAGGWPNLVAPDPMTPQLDAFAAHIKASFDNLQRIIKD